MSNPRYTSIKNKSIKMPLIPKNNEGDAAGSLELQITPSNSINYEVEPGSPSPASRSSRPSNSSSSSSSATTSAWISDLGSMFSMTRHPRNKIPNVTPFPVKPYLFSGDTLSTIKSMGRMFQLGTIGILAHDYALFHKHPTQRFANTVSKVILGSIISAHGYVQGFSNQNSFINHFGETRPDKTNAFFGGVIAAIAAPIALHTVIHLAYTYNINRKSPFTTEIDGSSIPTRALDVYAQTTGGSFSSDILGWHPLLGGKKITFDRLMNAHEDARDLFIVKRVTNSIINHLLTQHSYLSRLSAINKAYDLILNNNAQFDIPAFERNLTTISTYNSLTGFYTDYLLWKLNKKPANWKNHFYYGVYLVKALDTLLMAATLVRLAMTLADKINQYHGYTAQKNECQDKFNFNEQVANYVCSICGDWENIHVAFRDVNDLQKCVDALLQQTQDPQEISAKLKSITHKTNPLLSLFLSNSNWAIWTDKDFSELFETLTQFFETQFILNLSQATNTPVSDQKMVTLKQFIQQNTTRSVIWDSAYLKANQTQDFLNTFAHSATQVLKFSLADQNAQIDLDYYNLFTQSQLKNVSLQADMLLEAQIPAFVEGVFDSNITSLNLQGNNQASPMTPLIFQQGSQSKLEQLTLENFAFDLNFENDLTSFPVLNKLGLDRSTFESEDLDSLNSILRKNQVETFSAKFVDLTNIHRSFFSLLANQNPGTLFLDAIELNSSVVAELIRYLKSNSPYSLSLSGTTCAKDDWILLSRAIANSTLTEIILDSADLTNEKILILAQDIKQGSARFTKIVLSYNPFEDEAANTILQVMIHANVTEFSFRHIELGKTFAETLVQALPTSHISAMDLSATSLGNYLALIIQNAPGTLKSLDFNNNPITDSMSESSSLSLVNPPFSITTLLDEKQSDDATRNEANSTAATNLVHLGLCNSPSTRGMLAFDRVSSFTHIETNICRSAVLLSSEANLSTSMNAASSSMAGGALALLCLGLLYKSCTKPIRYWRNRFFAATPVPEQSTNPTPSHSTHIQRI